MIQRIQTIYLLIVVLVQTVASFCFFKPDNLIFSISIFSGIFAFITIFYYKNSSKKIAFAIFVV